MFSSGINFLKNCCQQANNKFTSSLFSKQQQQQSFNFSSSFFCNNNGEGSGSGSSSQLKKTPLFDFHLRNGGKMVEFGGWSMPLQYSSAGVIQSVNHTRTKASLFDVSHMCQLIISGKDRVKFIESLVPTDIEALEDNQGTYSALTNEQGGIIDDCVITKNPNEIYMVVNAGCAEKDLIHLNTQLERFNNEQGSDVSIKQLNDQSLIALQGPDAFRVLQSHIDLQKENHVNFEKLGFMQTPSKLTKISSIENCRITRCGYTGEDGFEIACDSKDVDLLSSLLLDTKQNSSNDPWVLPAGLGARDILRLEASLCLYGNDLNEDISPVDANIFFIISQSRRNLDSEKSNFLGSNIILERLLNKKHTHRRVGIETSKKNAIARSHTKIFDEKTNEQIGEVTSGAFSPTLKKPIAMAYVKKKYAKRGTQFNVDIRGKQVSAKVVKMPFQPTNYYFPAK